MSALGRGRRRCAVHLAARALALVAGVAVAGCLDPETVFGRACEVDSDCGGDLVCQAQQCLPVVSCAGGCAPGFSCIDDACVPDGDPDPRVLLDADFEPPGFSLGDLDGQRGWVVDRGAGGFGTAEVQTAVVATGTQALRVERNGAPGGDQLGPFFIVDEPIEQRFAELSARFAVDDGTVDNVSLSMFALDGGFLGGLGADDGGAFSVGNFDSSLPAQVIPAAPFHELALRFDFSLQVLEGFVDGSSLGSLPINPPNAPTRFGSVQMVSVGEVPPYVFDDVLLRTSDDPLP